MRRAVRVTRCGRGASGTSHPSWDAPSGRRQASGRAGARPRRRPGPQHLPGLVRAPVLGALPAVIQDPDHHQPELVHVGFRGLALPGVAELAQFSGAAGAEALEVVELALGAKRLGGFPHRGLRLGTECAPGALLPSAVGVHQHDARRIAHPERDVLRRHVAEDDAKIVEQLHRLGEPGQQQQPSRQADHGKPGPAGIVVGVEQLLQLERPGTVEELAGDLPDHDSQRLAVRSRHHANGPDGPQVELGPGIGREFGPEVREGQQARAERRAGVAPGLRQILLVDQRPLARQRVSGQPVDLRGAAPGQVLRGAECGQRHLERANCCFLPRRTIRSPGRAGRWPSPGSRGRQPWPHPRPLRHRPRRARRATRRLACAIRPPRSGRR